MVRLRFNIIIIIILIFAYSADKLNLLRDEVVDTKKFIEYYSINNEENGEEIVALNSFTIEKEYVLTDDKIIELTPEEIEAELKRMEEERQKKLLVVNEYEVKNGETLNQIIEEQGITEDIIRHYNPKIPKELKEGDKLKIPSENFIKYKVVKGDILSKIAQKHYVKSYEILSYNSLSANATLQIGQELFIKEPDLKKMQQEEEKARERAIEAEKIRQAKAKAKQEKEKAKQEKAKEISQSRFSVPVKYTGISSPFGFRRHPVMKRFIMHTGVDFKAKFIPVKSSQDGIVAYSGYKTGYGRIIIINHKNGYETRYAHLDRMDVKVGQKVSRDQVIGLTGNSGRITGPHLHFEIRKDDKPENPMKYMKVK